MFDLDLIFSGLEAFGTVVGAYFIAKQIALTRDNDKKNELIKTKERTLVAYQAISNELRNHNETLKLRFALENHKYLTEKDMELFEQEPELRKHVQFIYAYLSQFAIGVNSEIYDMDTLIDVSGRFFVRTFDRYEVYLLSIRDAYSLDVYLETENFVDEIRNHFISKGEVNLIKDKSNVDCDTAISN